MGLLGLGKSTWGLRVLGSPARVKDGQRLFCGAYRCWSLSLQYSTKEDKYEEEIKLLGEKLKEVRGAALALHERRYKFAIPCGF